MTENVECLLCADPCIFFGVFDCGHFSCGFCAIRIFSLSKENRSCPVCRHSSKELVVTRDYKSLSTADHQFNVAVLKSKASITTTPLFSGVLVDGGDLVNYIEKMHGNACPDAACWQDGAQDMYGMRDRLREHLRKDHGMDYCGICLENKPAFLCEHKTYNNQGELDAHNRGLSIKDPASFTGHPPCAFCGSRRFYDGEGLLKHMQQNHITCDLCNSGEFIFTFYKNREKLLEHFESSHKLCQHPDCKDLDPMLRVFRSDFDLAAHLQNRHNIRHNFTMESFAPAANSRGGNHNNHNTGSSSSNQAPASGANSFATKITFDFVNRKQILDLDSAAQGRDGSGRGRGGRGGRGRGGKGQQQAPAPVASRVPSHYEARTQFLNPVRIPIADGENAIRNTYTKGGKSSKASDADHPAAANDNDEADDGESKLKILNRALEEIGGFGRSSRSSRTMGSRQESTISTSSTMSAAARVDSVVHNDIEALNSLPADIAERNRLLRQRIEEYLPQASTRSKFVDACKDYLAGKLLATEHYKQLSGTFFTEEESLNAVFPLIVSTIPNEHKKEALMTARRMLTCNEFQKQERANKESTESRQEREEIERLRNARLNNVSKANNGRNKRAAWGAEASAPSQPGASVKGAKGGSGKKDNSIQSFLAKPAAATSGPKGVWTTSSAKNNFTGAAASSASPINLQQSAPKRNTNEVARGESAYGAGVNPNLGGWGGSSASSGHVDPAELPTLETMAPRWSSSNQKKTGGNSSNPWFRR